mgnify:CR=1 FL=1
MVVTGGRTGQRHGDGLRRQATTTTMLDCSRDFLFKLLNNEVVGDKDVERGAGIFLKLS